MTSQMATIHPGETMEGVQKSVLLLRRIRAEYQEMPGLTLTVPQAARLWSLSPSESLSLLSELVAGGFLTRDTRGAYRRPGCPRCS
jgi:Fic family protein